MVSFTTLQCQCQFPHSRREKKSIGTAQLCKSAPETRRLFQNGNPVTSESDMSKSNYRIFAICSPSLMPKNAVALSPSPYLAGLNAAGTSARGSAGNFQRLLSFLYCERGNCTSNGLLAESSRPSSDSSCSCAMAVHPVVPTPGPSQMCRKMHEPAPAVTESAL